MWKKWKKREKSPSVNQPSSSYASCTLESCSICVQHCRRVHSAPCACGCVHDFLLRTVCERSTPTRARYGPHLHNFLVPVWLAAPHKRVVQCAGGNTYLHATHASFTRESAPHVRPPSRTSGCSHMWISTFTCATRAVLYSPTAHLGPVIGPPMLAHLSPILGPANRMQFEISWLDFLWLVPKALGYDFLTPQAHLEYLCLCFGSRIWILSQEFSLLSKLTSSNFVLLFKCNIDWANNYL